MNRKENVFVLIFALAWLVCFFIGIASSAVKLKFCANAAVTNKYKSII